MRKLANKRPARKLRELPGIKAVPSERDARVMPHVVKNDVTAPRWFTLGTGKAHAFLVPAGPVVSPTGDGKIKSACGRSVNVPELTDASGHGRCKSCVKLLAEKVGKRGAGLSEPSIPIVDTGVVQGSPKEAESKRRAEIAEISGDAIEVNADIVERYRSGDKETARTMARQLNRRAPDAPVPHADRAPIGQRDHGAIDGVAMVQGPNQDATDGGQTDWSGPTGELPALLRGAPMAEPNPQALRPTWRNPATGEVEPRAAHYGGSLRERVDPKAVPDMSDRDGFVRSTAKQTKASKRRARARRVAERHLRERIEGRGEKFVPRGRMVDPVKAEVKRLANKGEQLPLKGW